MHHIETTTRFGAIRVMISVPGVPDPGEWARLTIDMIVIPVPETTQIRRLIIGALRRDLVSVLIPEFRGLSKLTVAADAAWYMESRIYALVSLTEFAAKFAMMRPAIADVLLRNVSSFIQILRQ